MAIYDKYQEQDYHNPPSALRVFGLTVVLLLIPALILQGMTFVQIADFSGISRVYNRVYSDIAGFLFFAMPVIGLISAAIISRVLVLLFRTYATLSLVILNTLTTGGILVIIYVAIITFADLSQSV